MDLDDTLLRDDLTISPRTVQAIRKAREQGVKFTIATGRMAISARPYVEQLGLDVPVITYHGALIQEALSGKVLYRQVIPIALAMEIAEKMLSRGIYAQVYLRDRVLVRELGPYSSQYARLAAVRIEPGDLLRVLAAEPEGVEKILIIGNEPDLDALALLLRSEFGERIHITKSKPNFLEMVDISVHKGAALAALAERFGIRREEVMAIGDSFNDIEMIEYAGLGVAMGNARPEVQKAADVVTGTNMEDGVAQAIERYVIKQK